MDDMNLVQLVEKFQNEGRCRSALEALRWPEGVTCPHCGSKTIYRVQDRNQFDCDSCRYQFSVTSGTIFHDSHLPLWKWMLAVYLMIESKKGMSANQLKRTLAVSYKTAWYLCHRIRKALEERNPEKLTGTVEMDETYVGGKRRHVGSGFVGNKTMVLGALQRGGHVHVKVERRKKATTKMLKRFIDYQTGAGTRRLMTDESTAYDGAVRPSIEHDSVNHSKEEWVRGDIHTNGIENVWSLFKRSVVGAFHHVSAKHLSNYFNEFDWRFNNRENPYLFRDTLMRLLNSKKLEFKQLIEETPS